MKKLKRILLINWLYFSKQLIEVEDINFLTGKNGAGKSTVIDALQIVLLGETNARNFNQAANERSQRTLDGYLRADMDDNNPHSRRGKDFSSYIACEFWDDVEGTRFVAGIVFECRGDGGRQDRDYKRHELLARHQEEKAAALEEIGKRYREMRQSLDRWRQQLFLVLWAGKEELEGEIHRCGLEKETCEEGIQKAAAEFEAIAASIGEKEARRTELIAACAQSDVSREEERLRGARETLLREQARLLAQLEKDALEIKREAVRLLALCRELSDWEGDEFLASVLERAGEMERAYALFADCGYEIFGHGLTAFEKARETAEQFAAAARDTAYQVKVMVDSWNGERDQKLAALEKLCRNVKDYPRGLVPLRERLVSELERRVKKPVRIDILADVLEIPETEELWRGAVEGYLNTQKFYLLVEPAFYREALRIYDQIKGDYAGQSFGLVDIGKLREKENLNPWDDSLARKIETENDLARSYIDYLLGRVVCCTHVDQLRRHRTAVTAEGMLYQGYVVRPMRRSQMEDAFIGRRAVVLRMDRLKEELAEVEKEIRCWKPVYETLSAQQDRQGLFSEYFVQSVVAQRQTDYLRGLEISGELEKVEEELSRLDLFWLHEQRKQIEILTGEIAVLDKNRIQCSNEKTRLEERVRLLEYEALPAHTRKLAEQEEKLTEEFTPAFIEDIGLPRYRQELARLKKAAVVHQNFSGRLAQTINERDAAQRRLFQARRDYAEAFKPCSFQQKYGELIERLFGQLTMADDTQLNARRQSELQENIQRFTDFRTYLKFDLETTDQNGSKQLLSQTLNTKSGGETQTPFYIAVLASFAQLYQVNNLSGLANNTVRLVVFDEAFNKMDSERIIESVRLLRKMGLQAIICTPPDKLPDIMPLADRTHLVIKDKYQMRVRSWGKEILEYAEKSDPPAAAGQV